MNSPVPKPFDVSEAAHTLNLAEGTVREMCRSGEIKAVKVGRAWRIPAAEMARLTGVQVPA